MEINCVSGTVVDRFDVGVKSSWGFSIVNEGLRLSLVSIMLTTKEDIQQFTQQ
jgi:hypothetical protein